MSKTILIFADGTGQLGGIRADQRLSNIYKMYRAMRPGPHSPIRPSEQVAFYDPGLGSGERGTLTPAYVRKVFERSEEHTSELQSLMRISYAVFCLTKKNTNHYATTT